MSKIKVCGLVVRCAVYAILPFYLFPHTDFEWVKLRLSEKGDADKPRKIAVLSIVSCQQNYALNVPRKPDIDVKATTIFVHQEV